MTVYVVGHAKLPAGVQDPSPVPCRRLGKKVLMFDIELAKLPPPTPDHSAISWKARKRPVLVLQDDAGPERRRQQTSPSVRKWCCARPPAAPGTTLESHRRRRSGDGGRA